MKSLSAPALSLCAALGAALLAACESDGVIPPPSGPDELFWELTLDHRAVTLSTGGGIHDTLTVTATPRTIDGAPLADAPAPEYVSRVTERVTVTSDGFLQAVSAGPEPVWVVATLTTGNVKRTDSLPVMVTANAAPPTLERLSIRSSPADSAKLPAESGNYRSSSFLPDIFLPARAMAPGDVPIPIYARDDGGEVVVSFRSSDTSVVLIDRLTGELMNRRPGRTTLYASATAFGVERADTLAFRVGLPLTGLVSATVAPSAPGTPPVRFFRPRELRVGVGALVVWTAIDPQYPADGEIRFSDPTNAAAVTAYDPFLSSRFLFLDMSLETLCQLGIDCAGGGNAYVSTAAVPIALRVFTAPGTYDYIMSGFDVGGRIVVEAE